MVSDTQALLDLVDWRRRVGDLYRTSGPDAIARFRHGRDELFRSHPQSPIEPEERDSFTGLHLLCGVILNEGKDLSQAD